ncbi:MAG: NADH-quinone oxidoreductase subunit C [Brachymonas sp.]|nr:NADH-quinone oxidoreductase subunit C [Brachymonas sp.]
MTAYAIDPHALQDRIQKVLGAKARSVDVALGEVTAVVGADDYLAAAAALRDAPGAQFNQLMDLCGVDYSQYQDRVWQGPRFCVVLHLLSTTLNQRLRLKVFAPDDDAPRLPSVNDLWNAANWFEREAFDLYGIVFDGHPDLRRILTDYGFVGHPFRKDFPLSGHVEMQYDAAQRRVVYVPVSIEPREITPRIVREPGYGRAG